jgi:hypothetical protein
LLISHPCPQELQSTSLKLAGQHGVGPGLYDTNQEYSNTLIGKYERDETEDGTGYPILYLAEVGSLVDVIVGIPNRYYTQTIEGQHVGGNIDTARKLQYLFMVHRRKEWPKCWESVIRTTAAAGEEDSSSEEEDELYNQEHCSHH